MAFCLLRHVCLPICISAIALSMVGCEKPAQSKKAEGLPQPPANPTQKSHVAHIHWLGIERIAADTNSTSFMTVWRLPETLRLKEQTLHKLAAVLAGTTGSGVQSNANRGAHAPLAICPWLTTNQLRPLLDDLIQGEWQLEVYQTATNRQGPDFSLAVRLNEQRAGAWEAALAATNHSAEQSATTLQTSRSGEWFVIRSSHFPTVPELSFSARADFSEQHTVGTSNAWLEVTVDLSRVLNSNLQALVVGEHLAAPPQLSLRMIGEGGFVRTRGTLDFSEPLELKFEPWNVPTNFIGSDIASFTAAQGFGNWLSGAKMWQGLEIGTPPNQLYLWAAQSVPMQTFFAAPETNASNQVNLIADKVLKNMASGSNSSSLAKFGRGEGSNGLRWLGLPYLSPHVEATAHEGYPFVFGGTFIGGLVQGQLPGPLLDQIYGRTNLVYYDWEITGQRIEQLTYVLQFCRLVSGNSQLSSASASLSWLKSLVAAHDNCITEITLSNPKQLSINRKSAFGLSALESQLLADWLDSGRFPRGLHSFEASPNSGSSGPGAAGM